MVRAVGLLCLAACAGNDDERGVAVVENVFVTVVPWQSIAVIVEAAAILPETYRRVVDTSPAPKRPAPMAPSRRPGY